MRRRRGPGASGSPLGILAGETTTAAMGLFPLSLIPTFFVPLLLILHGIALLNTKAGVADLTGKAVAPRDPARIMS